MKKFLTLTLALVMALAIAAPAMAFVDYEYAPDSEYDLDAWLTDYDTGADIFTSNGVITTLPEADRGYVTNEMVGVVVTVLVPAGNDGGDAYPEISSENVNFGWSGSRVDVNSYASKDNTKLTGVGDTLLGEDEYWWRWYGNDEVLVLEREGDEPLFESDLPKKDFTAAWLILGRVTDDDASVTVSLYNGRTYNEDLELDGNQPVQFKIGDNKYDVRVYENAAEDGYIFEIRPEGGAADGKVFWIYTDDKWKSQDMAVTSGAYESVDGTKSYYSYTVTNLATITTLGSGTDIIGDRGYVSTNTSAVLPATHTNLNGRTQTAAVAIIAAHLNLDAPVTGWTWAASNTDIILQANKAGVPAPTGQGTEALTTAPSVTGLGAASALNNGTDMTYSNLVGEYIIGTDGKLYDAVFATTPFAGRPTQVGRTAGGDAAAKDYAADVMADFALNPKLAGNVLKPAYLGNFKLGLIEEIVLDVQPWQAYVTIPDIEVIDPPKTGDAATLAGFVMIVLAAAGVVIFKKVRA